MASSRLKKSTGKVDIGELVDFEHKLNLAARSVVYLEQTWEADWSQAWLDQIRSRVPTGPGVPVHLKDEIALRQYRGVSEALGEGTYDTGVTMGDAFWWWFLEHGTSSMPPHPIVIPAMKKIRTAARKDLGVRAVDLILRHRLKESA